MLIYYIAELCKGSTSDSDSLCSGSNPDSAATSERALLAPIFFTKKSIARAAAPPFSQRGSLASAIRLQARS